MTDITAENLLADGYREWPGSFGGEKRFFQKRFSDSGGVRFFINFREFSVVPVLDQTARFDVYICFETDSGGYVWITIKEDTIEKAVDRATKLWEASGSCYYEDW